MISKLQEVVRSILGCTKKQRTLGLAAIFLLVTGCSGGSSNDSGSNIIKKPIRAYCTETHSYASQSPITVSGTARFEFRVNGNGLVTTNPEPIKFAEVRVSDMAGNIAQCAETDVNGTFSLALPGNGAAYLVEVLSRSHNAQSKAYILDNPNNNTEYSLSQTIIANGNQSLSFLARAKDDLKGGAFNILEQLYKAQKYLRETTLNCDQIGAPTYFPDCRPFTEAPVVHVYWTPGLSPGVYFGSADGVSFYLSGTNQMYILGGIGGDTSNTDMDHFDNSVIIHEYAHFIEDNYGRPDSPGGSHNGNSVIDPRLAWGEGWANFFQAAVLGTSNYRDTYGHIECTGSNPQGLPNCHGVHFDEPLDPAPLTSYRDIPTASGEGNFREFSIARLLFDVAKSIGGTSQFSELWTILRGPSNGFRAIADRFKSIGRFHVIQRAISTPPGTDWSPLRTAEMHTGDLSNYATPFISCSDPAQYWQAMSIRKDSRDNGSFATSDQLRNNDFFVYHHPGGSFTASMNWSGSDQVDLDLYLYREGYSFGYEPSMAAKSDGAAVGTSGSESITLPSLSSGYYMINIMAYTGIYETSAPRNTFYRLMINGSNTCPNP